MLRKRREPKAKKTVAEVLLRDMQGTAAEKLALFEKLKAHGGFVGEDRAELLRVERMLRTFAGDGQVIDRLRTLKAGDINGMRTAIGKNRRQGIRAANPRVVGTWRW